MTQGAVIDLALVVWFALTALSVVYVAWDAWRNNPEMKVMRWGWVLITFYTGPVGAALYVLSCQEPAPGTHEAFITPLWKQALGSTIHCMAGDATGVVAAAALTATLGLPMGLDFVAEYVFGFAFGLLVFQALFMRGMLGGSYVRALRHSLYPEWVSMNAVMAGMGPVMLVIMGRHMSAMEPTSLRFWGTMSLASLVGAAVAYPANVWLVAARLKHGMGTDRALGHGGSPVQAVHAHGGSASDLSHQAPPEPAPAGFVSPTLPQKSAVALLSLLALATGLMLSALFGDLGMRPGMDRAHRGAPSATMPGM